jgi:hypothetical protein
LGEAETTGDGYAPNLAHSTHRTGSILEYDGNAMNTLHLTRLLDKGPAALTTASGALATQQASRSGKIVVI